MRMSTHLLTTLLSLSFFSRKYLSVLRIRNQVELASKIDTNLLQPRYEPCLQEKLSESPKTSNKKFHQLPVIVLLMGTNLIQTDGNNVIYVTTQVLSD